MKKNKCKNCNKPLLVPMWKTCQECDDKKSKRKINETKIGTLSEKFRIIIN